MCYRAVDAIGGVGGIPLRMQVLTLLRLEELRSNSEARRVPAHAAHDVSRPCGLVRPAWRHQFIRQVKAPSAGWNAVVAEQRHRLWVPAYVNVARLEDARNLVSKSVGTRVG